jgi:anaerobic selenocysteine-containing dehydrogenase
MLQEDVVKTTCSRDCYDACGLAVYKENGIITKVLGDPDHAISRGKLCGKCAIAYNGAWRDPALRLTSPLRRVGAKGTATFAEISWDEALAETAARFRSAIDAGEATKILHTHYTGTVSLLAGSFPLRLFNRMGATEVDPDTVCNKAGHVALELTFGNSLEGALAALIAFSGNVGRPGAGFLYMNGTNGRGIDMSMITMPELASSGTRSMSHMDLAATLEDPRRSRALVNWNNNPAASSPEQNRLRKALEREDLFHVAVDLFHTDTTAYADIVLPAASFLEFNDLVLPYFDLTLSAQVKTCEPPGQALPNQEIFRRLARAMGYDDPGLFESESALIDRLLAQTACTGSFVDLAKVGTTTLFAEPRLQFADLNFATPSGRIELASDRAVELGLPRVPAPHADERTKPGQLRIISPASPWQMNSSYGNDSVIQRRLGPATVTLHPDDAAAQGFAEGDAVVLVNEAGRLKLAVTISRAAQPGVGIIYKGRWPSASPNDANVNVLVAGRKSDMAESTTVHSTVVGLERAETPA